MTARHWLTVLDTGWAVFRQPPHFANIRKRAVKPSKLCFHGVGLAGHPFGIEHAGLIAAHSPGEFLDRLDGPAAERGT